MQRSLPDLNAPKKRRQHEGPLSFCYNTHDNNNEGIRHKIGRKGNKTVGHVGRKALSRSTQQLFPKPWWHRRRSVHFKHAKGTSGTSSSCSSVGIQLFSTFFVTPKELTAALRKRERSLERRQRQCVQCMEKHKVRHDSCKEKAKTTVCVVSGISGGDHMPLVVREQGVQEDNTEELSSMLTTVRLLCTSVKRSAAACVDVRAGSRALCRQCRGLTSWVCPMLLHTASRTRRASCNVSLSE
ncbi:hypothetical protein TraAM80_02647 [Trypanosoma rangeli]|uniref:Uncharacterized protein n=1 Tax=Trypanosoma rangeli TaxID=5698 RepID=A0A3R7MN80_TRYRA|nr:uncharacterized protein TraAM80_02647 [Trypanosoma rangeli]RNF08621.1 hypothetical protein TraAM80_02647 [Trypanosoma rangeli]|eukprot:RNF08621.1 hypothetical protein TraAM80_02647 [Trypanosoma rangeli]